MTEKIGHIQLNRTDLWVPRALAKREAATIYTEFSMSIANIEDISLFSHLYHSDFSPDEVKKYTGPDNEERFMRLQYLTRSLGQLADRLTLKSHVAASMVVAEVDDSAIGGYVVEPFVGKEVLPELHDIYLTNRRVKNSI